MSATPLISVVMPVYNGERYLRQSVESILNQTWRDFEFIIIDDGSTDATAEIVQQFEDKRILVIRNSANLGLTASLNKGIAAAKGKFIARMDADDISLPERFEKQIGFFRTHPEIEALGTSTLYIDEHGNRTENNFLPTSHFCIKWELNFNSPIAHPTVMMTRRVIKECGGYTPSFEYAVDYWLWWRISELAILGNLPEPLLLYRLHSANVGRTYQAEQTRERILLRQKILSAALKETVPIDIIQIMENREYDCPDNSLRVACLIHRLFRAYCKDNRLSDEDERYISEDVATKLFSLAAAHIRSPRLWRYLILSCQYSPELILRICKWPFKHLSRRMAQQVSV